MPNHHLSNQPDILKLFFEDVAQISTINGKHDYLPLTRKIQRGGVLARLLQSSPEATFQKILYRQNKAVDEFNRQCEILKQPKLDVHNLADEIETFLEDSQQSVPQTLAKSLGKRQRRENEEKDKFEDWGWRCFYLLSLFPPGMRNLNTELCFESEAKLYFRKIHTEAQEAKRKLVEGTMRYAINIARFYVKDELPYIELVQEGIIGLMTAADKYNERKGHFQSYAGNWVRQRISRYIADHARLIRVPVHYSEEARQLKRVQDRLQEENGGKLIYWQFFQEAGWLSSDEIETLRKKLTIIDLPQKEASIKQHIIEYFQLMEQHQQSNTQKLSTKELRTLKTIIEAADKHQQNTGEIPTLLETFAILGWAEVNEPEVFQNIITLIDTEKDECSKLKSEQERLHPKLMKAIRKFETLQLTINPIYSLEQVIDLDQSHRAEYLEIGNHLVDITATMDLQEHDIPKKELESLLGYLSEREREIIELRYGLADGIERTLDEVGKLLGVTRERIRQIESKSLTKLRHPTRIQAIRGYTYTSDSDIATNVEAHLRKLLNNKLEAYEQIKLDSHVQLQTEIDHIERLIQHYIPGARRRIWRADKQSGRAELFREILLEIGQPTHYGDIHVKALERIPEGMEFAKTATYTTLFYHRYFRPFGNSMFGLVEWETTTETAGGEKILQHCPMPLLPVITYPTAFFESIMVGREILKRQVLTARQFWAEMVAWAEQDTIPQDAFDTWYATGLINWVDWVHEADNPLQLTMPKDAKIAQARRSCIETLCHRLLKTSELLLVIKQISPATLNNIQKVLFGDARSGFDVPNRLIMMTALDVVQPIGDEWRLTDLGYKILESNPPSELPDFGEIESYQLEEETSAEAEWQDDLDLMDL